MVKIQKKSSFPGLPTTSRAVALVLGGDPKGKNFLYCTNNSVVVRNIENPSEVYCYTDHQKPPSCAKYSPSGFYICSGDAIGNVRIWDTTQPEHLTKYEYRPITGKICDISWDAENKRIAVCGEGREKFAHVFLFDSGSSVGDLKRIGKKVNSIDIKPTRPYRLAAASEDFAFYRSEGPPYKNPLPLAQGGTRFANCVRYSSDGKYLAGANSDGNIYLYDAKTPDIIGTFGGEKSHDGGVYSLCFSSDGKELLSASADKTCKIWNVETREELVKFEIGTAINDQQLGCLWVGDHLLSVSLSGEIKYLNRNDPSTPLRVISGHNKSITQLTTSNQNAIFTGSFDGVVVKWDPATSDSKRLGGKGHETMVSGMVYDPTNNQLITAGIDNKVRFACADSCQYNDQVVGTDSEPFSMVRSKEGDLIVACQKELVLIQGGKRTSSIAWERNHKVMLAIYGNKLVASSKPEERFAVDGAAFAVYEIETDKLVDTGIKKPFPYLISSINFSSDGARLLVAGEKAVHIYEMVDDFKEEPKAISTASNVKKALWCAGDKHIVTAAIDVSLNVYCVEQSLRVGQLLRSHPKALINQIAWLDDNTLVSAADDCTVNQWTVAF